MRITENTLRGIVREELLRASRAPTGRGLGLDEGVLDFLSGLFKSFTKGASTKAGRVSDRVEFGLGTDAEKAFPAAAKKVAAAIRAGAGT